MQTELRQRPLGELFSELASETGTLVRKEVQLAKVEMTRALERRKADDAELVSVILEDCAWKERDFTKYQLVQPGGRAVRGWSRHRNAFNEVEKALRKVIEQMLAKGGGQLRR